MNSKTIFVVFVIIYGILADTYTLSGVTFDDGGSASGSFSFDGSNCGTIDISTSAGSTLPDAHYSSDCIPLGASRILFPLRDPNNNNIITRYLSFQFDSALSSGVTNIDTTPNGNSYECNNCDPVRYITGGSVSTDLSPSQFCAQANQNDWTYGSGFYCNSPSSFLQCYGDDPVQFAQFNCPLGTSCQCSNGVECSDHGTQSPCTSN